MKLTLPQQAICSKQELANQNAISLARRLAREHRSPAALDAWLRHTYPAVNNIWEFASCSLTNTTAEYVFVEELQRQLIMFVKLDNPRIYGDIINYTEDSTSRLTN